MPARKNPVTYFNISKEYASISDLTILVMGLNTSIEDEGLDRYSLLLPGVQNEFINNITNVSNNIIIILINAGCVDISKFNINNNIKSILWAGYGGMYGGQGVSDIIFGKFNPTGLTTQTWYKNNFIYEVNMMNMTMTPIIELNYPGRGYRYYNGNNIP